jgi:V-type H+-transporting ATPase subunit B
MHAQASVDLLSKELAFKAHVDAVQRDYVCEPRLGRQPRQRSMQYLSTDGCLHNPLLCWLLPAEYRTVGGVAGPLVVVDLVKARVT